MTWTSEATSPFGSGQPHEFSIIGPPPAAGDVILTVTAEADLDAGSEFVIVRLNGVSLGGVFGSDGSNCTPVSAVKTITAAEYNDLVAGGDAVFTLTAMASVSPDECESSWIMMSVEYVGSSAIADCNANGVPDACDIVEGTSSDANGNGVPDECE